MDSHKVLHSCWIGNITDEYSREELQNYFTEKASKMYRSFVLSTFNMKFNKERGRYQCWLNFEDQNDAKDAVNFFSKRKLAGIQFEAMYRKPKQIKPNTSGESSKINHAIYKRQAQAGKEELSDATSSNDDTDDDADADAAAWESEAADAAEDEDDDDEYDERSNASSSCVSATRTKQ
jgi:hypothetical protein